MSSAHPRGDAPARPRTLRLLLGLFLAAAVSLAIAAPAQADAIIQNGVVQLGVHDEAHLNVCCGAPSSGTGTTIVGLRYLPTGAASTEPGCTCEGWGAGDAISNVSGWADDAFGGAFNITPISFVSNGITAVSVVEIGGILRVTHDYHPSLDTPNLYEVTVTIQNISGNVVEPRYTRAMDWDIEPTPFAEYVTIETGTSTNLLFSSDNGFAIPDPFQSKGAILFTGEAVDSGPTDHGAVFDFGFDALAPSESVSFQIYYGAAGTEIEALNALAAVDAEVFSLGQPSSFGGRDEGIPNTFIFGFAGVGGDPVPTPDEADLAIDKNCDPGPVTEGDTYECTIAVTNNGPDPATDVEVTDNLSANTSFDSATGASCAPEPGDPNVVTCDVGALAVGETKTITVTIRAESGGLAEDLATVRGDQTDPVPANNQDRAATVIVAAPVAADVGVDKSGPTDAQAGDEIAYEITVTNNGPADATGVTVTDQLPNNLEYVSATGAACSVSQDPGPPPGPETVTCEIGDLAAGDSVTIVLTVEVQGQTGSTENCATVDRDQDDPNPANDSDCAETAVAAGDPATLVLEPEDDTNPVDSQHCVTATVTDEFGNPTPGVTVVFDTDGSTNAQGEDETDANGEAEFCYTGPALPGADTIDAFADTDNDDQQDPGEPSDTATKKWVAPASTEGCKVTMGGWIVPSTGGKGTFGGNAQAKNGVRGEQTYTDHQANLKFKSIQTTTVSCSGDRASIFGTGSVNGGPATDYRIDVMDSGEPGRTDTYRIRFAGYDSGEQPLAKGGNIQIHKAS